MQRLARVNDDVQIGGNLRQFEANRFPQPALHAISPDGFSQGPRNRKADSRPFRLSLGEIEGRKERSGITLALIINTAKVARSEQLVVFWKRKVLCRFRQGYFILA